MISVSTSGNKTDVVSVSARISKTRRINVSENVHNIEDLSASIIPSKTIYASVSVRKIKTKQISVSKVSSKTI